jgi:site-specific DNA-methyltransferase (adenine-specific)
MNYPNFKIDNQECLTWLSSQGEGSYQVIVLDPPYNVNYRYSSYRDNKSPHEYLFEQLLVLAKCERLLKPGGSLFYLNYPEFAGEIWGRVEFLKKVKWLSWVYHPHLGGKPLRKGSRAWLWFAKGEPMINPEAFMGEYRNQEDPRIQERIAKGLKPVGLDWFVQEPIKNTSREKREHPCQVPESMVERFILGTSNPGDRVGDCYTGSGTTGICAIRHGRSFEGCEIDPAYVEVANKAIQREWEARKGFDLEIRKAI